MKSIINKIEADVTSILLHNSTSVYNLGCNVFICRYLKEKHQMRIAAIKVINLTKALNKMEAIMDVE